MADTPAKPKRFYKDVTIAEVDGTFVVQLDGRTAKTAGRHPLGATGKELADAIATEWDAQLEVIDLSSMPLTRLQGFALDGGEAGRTEWSETILSYASSDLLCYRGGDPALAKRQADTWQEPLNKVGERFGGVFAVTEGIVAVDQPQDLLQSIADGLDQLSAAQLFATKLLTEITGSAVLALALLHGDMRSDDAFAAARLDETYQAEKWGIDAEAAAREARLKQDFEHVLKFLRLSA